ncbi:heparan-alpha-glucosaminide N-acetyltransferase-like [Limulus polyphemus]|uniref:Heparan-alpha-glucosaminide N-acetyltransferase-like n=1 Tax=Limulus polyphemus TaxID=6850 RepID=A0ABM1BB32_LIMPO|nr:heparan-alpha-glucosaminide N-acetyltransferase-like [Limulus polyphemus]
MIFANFSNGDYLIMEHAPWDGLCISDVILPCFVWVMGVSTALSFNSKLCKGVSRWMLFRRIVTRSLSMIIIGVVININLVQDRKDFPSKLRIPGVLQLIGVAFFIASSTHLLFFKRNNEDQEQCWHPVTKILLCKGDYLTMLIILSVHTLIMFFLEVPGCPRGYHGPGGLHMNGRYQNCTGGAAGYLDLLVFGENHIFQKPAMQSIYNTTIPFDPEGLLATLTSSFLVFIGIQGATAYVLAGGFRNDGLIPVNKNLWSLSFVLTIGFISLTAFTVLYVTVDVKRLWNGGPFHFPGMNPLFLFIGHALFSQMFPWKWKVAGYSRLQRILLDLWGAAVWIGVSFYLYYKKIFLAL